MAVSAERAGVSVPPAALSTGAAAAAPVPRSTPPRDHTESATPLPHIACVRLLGVGVGTGAEAEAGAPDAADDTRAGHEAWLAACYRITPWLERVSARCALLDLGNCTGDEAAAVAARLLHLLQRHVAWLTELAQAHTHPRVRIGIGTNVLGAQVALLTARDETPIRVLPAADALAAIHAFPIRRLPALHPAGTVPTEAVERLERYGLRTVGQLARLGENALRRQFGERLGMALAALAAGRDLRPLLPALQPQTLRCRLAFESGASPARVLRALAPAADRIARWLAEDGRQTSRLRLALTWQTGGVSAGDVRLRTPTAEARQLAQRLSDLCGTLLLAAPAASATGEDHDHPAGAAAAAIEQVLIEVGDLVPLTPAQATFWRTEARRQAAIIQVAEALTHRFGGQPQLVRVCCATPHAIVQAERYHWLPVGMADGQETPDYRPSRRRGDQVLGEAALSDVVGAGSPWDGVPHRLHWW